MFTKRLFNVLVVLILGVVAFFALRMAADTGTPRPVFLPIQPD